MRLKLQSGSMPEKGLLDQNHLPPFVDPEGIADGGSVGGVDVLIKEEFSRLDRELKQNFLLLPALHPKEKRSRGLGFQGSRGKEG
jgi:hypothetical protein